MVLRTLSHHYHARKPDLISAYYYAAMALTWHDTRIYLGRAAKTKLLAAYQKRANTVAQAYYYVGAAVTWPELRAQARRDAVHFAKKNPATTTYLATIFSGKAATYGLAFDAAINQNPVSLTLAGAGYFLFSITRTGPFYLGARAGIMAWRHKSKKAKNLSL